MAAIKMYKAIQLTNTKQIAKNAKMPFISENKRKYSKVEIIRQMQKSVHINNIIIWFNRSHKSIIIEMFKYKTTQINLAIAILSIATNQTIFCLIFQFCKNMKIYVAWQNKSQAIVKTIRD